MRGNVSYIDGVGRVTVVNGVAHIDLVTIVPPAQEGQQAQAEVTHRLALTLPQFVRMCAEMAGHLKRMEEKGLITRREQQRPAS